MVLDQIIMKYYYFLLVALFVLFFYLIKINGSSLKNQFKNIKRKIWIILLIIFLLGLIIRVFYVPHTHQIYEDEYAYKDVSKNFFEEQSFHECHERINNSCTKLIKPIWAPGWSFFLSTLYFFTTSYNAFFIFAAVISSLAVILIFLLAYVVYKKEIIALISSLIMATLPVVIKFSTSLSAETFSMIFIILTLIFLFMFLEKRDNYKLLYLLLVTVMIMVQVKFENLILLPIIGLFLFLNRSKIKKSLFSNKTLFVILCLAIVLSFFFYSIHIYNVIKDESSLRWIYSQNVLKENFENNIYRDAQFFFVNSMHPIIITILFFFGSWFYYQINKRNLFIFYYVILSFFVLYSFHVQGHFTIGSAERYVLSFYAPIVLLSSYGIMSLYSLFRNTFMKKMLIFVFVLLVISFPLKYNSYIFDENNSQAEFKYLKEVNIPDNCIVFSESIYRIMVVTDTPSFYLNKLSQKDFVKNLNSECILIYDNVLLQSNYSYKDTYFYVELWPFNNTANIYPENKNPFFLIENINNKYNNSLKTKQNEP